MVGGFPGIPIYGVAEGITRSHLPLSTTYTAELYDLVVLMLLHRLVQGQNSSEEELEIKIALHYTFCLHLVPNAGLKWCLLLQREGGSLAND